jgi:acyl carrier protein
MTRAEIEAAVADLLSLAIGRPVVPAELVSRDSEPRWDSLRHVELIFMLEDRFAVQFTEEEMGALRSSRQIADALERKHAP